jgi:hypothetical protein
LTPAGYRGKDETPQGICAEEVRLPTRRKQIPEAQRNGQRTLPKTLYRRITCEFQDDIQEKYSNPFNSYF